MNYGVCSRPLGEVMLPGGTRDPSSRVRIQGLRALPAQPGLAGASGCPSHILSECLAASSCGRRSPSSARKPRGRWWPYCSHLFETGYQALQQSSSRARKPSGRRWSYCSCLFEAGFQTLQQSSSRPPKPSGHRWSYCSYLLGA